MNRLQRWQARGAVALVAVAIAATLGAAPASASFSGYTSGYVSNYWSNGAASCQRYENVPGVTPAWGRSIHVPNSSIYGAPGLPNTSQQTVDRSFYIDRWNGSTWVRSFSPWRGATVSVDWSGQRFYSFPKETVEPGQSGYYSIGFFYRWKVDGVQKGMEQVRLEGNDYFTYSDGAPDASVANTPAGQAGYCYIP